MIERGRDDLVDAMVQKWMRRVAGAGDSAGPPRRKKDEIFPGRLPDPQQPQSGTSPGNPNPPPPSGPFPPLLIPTPPPPPPPPSGPFPPVLIPVPPAPPSGPFPPVLIPPIHPPPPPPTGSQHSIGFGTQIYGNPNFVPQLTADHYATSEAEIAAAVDQVQNGNRVIEHDIDDLQPVLSFGGNVDFAAVRGTATILPQQATAAAAEALQPNLVQLWNRWDRYTDVRVASSVSIGTCGLWIGANVPGANTINGYLGEYDSAGGRMRIYRVDANTLVQIAAAVCLVPTLVEFQRVGAVLTARGGGTTITATDSTYGAGYCGFGGHNQADGDVCIGFQITRPTI